jgi:hypothetical protein
MAAAEVTEQQLEKLSSVLGTVNAGMLSNFKSQKAQELAQQQLIKSIMKLTGETETGAKAIADKIKKDDEAARRAEQREQSIADGMKKSVNGLKQFFEGATSSAQALYNSDSAFTAVIPTVNLLGDTVKGITSALMSFGAGLPFIGGFFTGFDKATAMATDMAVKVMALQLENAQKVVGGFNTLTKTGMTFGASLETLKESAAAGGMSLDTYTKFVTSNIEGLSTMGASLETSAARASKLSATIAQNNSGLLTLYGSYDALAGATTDYAAMLARYGIDVARSDKDLTQGAKDYLYNMKELSSLTGKNADALKKEEEARSRSAAYQLAKGRMTADQAQNTQRAIDISNKMYGKTAGDFATEFIATNGNVTSKTALQFQAMFPEIAETVKQTLGATSLKTDEFNKEQGRIINDRRDLNRKEVESREHLYRLQAGGVKNDILELMNPVAAAFLASFSSQGDIVKAIAEMEKNKAAVEGANISGGTVISGTIKTLEGFKQAMDTLTIKNLPDLANVTTNLIKLNQQIMTEFAGPVMNKAVDKFAWAVNELVKSLGGKGNTGAPPVAPIILKEAEARRAAEDAAAEASAKARLPGATKEERIAAMNAEREAAKARATEETARRKRQQELETEAKLGAKFPVKPGQFTGAGAVDPKLISTLNTVFDKLPDTGMRVTAGNDPSHANKSYSKHPLGEAADIKFDRTTSHEQRVKLAEQINGILRDLKISGKAEVHQDEGGGGEHIHMQIDKEKAKPAGAKAADEKHAEMRSDETQETLVAILDVMREQRDTSEKLARALT